MNLAILKPEIQKYISDNLNQEITKIILKGSTFKDVSIQELANQIIAKKKSEKKLPTWFNAKDIYFPPKISIEQTSSEITAKYKSTIVKGDTIIDITGGFGVDCYYFSKLFKEVIHCELNDKLSNIGETFIKIVCALENKKSIFGGTCGRQSFSKKTFPLISFLLDGSI